MHRKFIYTVVGAALLTAVVISDRLLSTNNHAAPPTAIDIDINQHLQTMDGWEVTARLWEFDKLNDRYDPSWLEYADPLFTRLTAQFGINRIRLEIMSGAENPVDYWSQFVAGRIGYTEVKQHFYEKINDNDTADRADPRGFQFSALDYRIDHIVQPLATKLAARGERLYINLCYVDFAWTDLQGSLAHGTQPAEYAEFILVHFRHLRDKYGIVPDSLEIILEPDNSRDWRGAQIGAAIVTVAETLAAAGFHPKIIAPSTSRLHQAPFYLNGMLATPGAAEHLDTVAYHRYGAANYIPFMRRAFVQKIADRATQAGARTAMLEHVGGDIDELLEDLRIGNVSSWQQYAIATNGDDNGAYLMVVDTTADPDRAIRPAAAARLLQPLFQSVRYGATRIATHDSDDSVTSVGFINPDGSLVVAIRNSTAQSRDIDIRGLPGGDYQLLEVAEAGFDADPAVQSAASIGASQPLHTHVAAHSLLRIVNRANPGVDLPPPR